MTIGKLTRVIAAASLFGAAVASPAWAHGTSAGIQTQSGGIGIQSSRDVQQNGDVVGQTPRGDNVVIAPNSDRTDVRSWAEQAAAMNGGVVKEDQFLDEMGRRFDQNRDRSGLRSIYLEDLRARWEALDTNNQGLTPAQVSTLAGDLDTSRIATQPAASMPSTRVGPARSY